MKKKLLFTSLCLISFILVSNGYCESKKVLIIHITGITRLDEIHGFTAEEFAELQRVDQHIEFALNEQFGNARVFQVTHLPSYPDDNLNELGIKLFDTIFLKNDKILLEVALRYHGDIYQWAKENSYPEDVLQLYENASNYVVRAVKYFKSSYPDSQIMGFSMYAGANVLIRAIEKNTNEFDSLLMVAPPIQNEEKFSKLLLAHGYDESQVTLITAEGDEFAPIELQGGQGYRVIKLMKE